MANAVVLTSVKLFLALLMVLLGAIALGGASASYDSKPGEGEDRGFDTSGDQKDAWEALDTMGWWKIEYHGGLSGDGYNYLDHRVTMNMGLNGYAMEVEQDFDGGDDKYYASAEWVDDDSGIGEWMDDNCDDVEDIDGWDDLNDEYQDAINVLCTCRSSGTALKAFAIAMILLLFTMSVLDILRLVLECCSTDCVSCMASFFSFVQLVLTLTSFVCTLIGMGLAAFGCPMFDGDAAWGILASQIASAAVQIEDEDDVDYSAGGGMIMIIVVFVLHIVYLVLTIMTPKMAAGPPTPQGVVVQAATPQGVVMQAATPKFDPQTGQPIGQPVSGAKFDPQTGAPIPKFDAQTGQQNW